MLPMQQIWLAIDARQVGGIEVHIIHLANDSAGQGISPHYSAGEQPRYDPLYDPAQTAGLAL